MGFFDDFGKNASKAAGKAMETAESVMKTAINRGSDFAEISKLKMKISAEQKSIDELYYYIGRIIYEECVDSGAVPDSIKEPCSEVYDHKARIRELQGKIELIRGDNQASQNTDEDEVDFGTDEEVVVDEVSVVTEESADAEVSKESETEIEEEKIQYGVLRDIDSTQK